MAHIDPYGPTDLRVLAESFIGLYQLRYYLKSSSKITDAERRRQELSNFIAVLADSAKALPTLSGARSRTFAANKWRGVLDSRIKAVQDLNASQVASSLEDISNLYDTIGYDCALFETENKFIATGREGCAAALFESTPQWNDLLRCVLLQRAKEGKSVYFDFATKVAYMRRVMLHAAPRILARAHLMLLGELEIPVDIRNARASYVDADGTHCEQRCRLGGPRDVPYKIFSGNVSRATCWLVKASVPVPCCEIYESTPGIDAVVHEGSANANLGQW